MKTVKDGESYYDETVEGVVLTGKTVKEVEFEKCRFDKCVFIECIFESCRFIDCEFIGSSLSAVKPYNSIFNTVAFRDSKIKGIDWTRAKNVSFLDFHKCDISYCNFGFMKLPRLKLTESVAHEVSFNEADLTEGTFIKTDFEGAVFSHTNLTKADFSRAVNYGIDFNFNTLTKAVFTLPEAYSLLKSLDIVITE